MSYMSDLPEVTEAEEITMREVYDEVILTSHGLYFHPVDPDTDVPICRDFDGPNGKDDWSNANHRTFSNYPVGWRDICKYCGATWRQDER